MTYPNYQVTPHISNKITMIYQLEFYKIPISGLMAENPFGLVFNDMELGLFFAFFAIPTYVFMSDKGDKLVTKF